MTLAVEPMVVAGKRDVKALKDNWTMVTVDNKPACHFEHTVASRRRGRVLTDGRQPFTL
jgi:methionyl aminopeptidase